MAFSALLVNFIHVSLFFLWQERERAWKGGPLAHGRPGSPRERSHQTLPLRVEYTAALFYRWPRARGRRPGDRPGSTSGRVSPQEVEYRRIRDAKECFRTDCSCPCRKTCAHERQPCLWVGFWRLPTCEHRHILPNTIKFMIVLKFRKVKTLVFNFSFRRSFQQCPLVEGWDQIRWLLTCPRLRWFLCWSKAITQFWLYSNNAWSMYRWSTLRGTPKTQRSVSTLLF